MTRLSGEQIHEFTEALLDAYLTHNDLRMLARSRRIVSRKGEREMSSRFAGRYQVKRELGRGAFDAVYLAQDERLNHRAVAVKVLHAQLTVDAETLHLFEREAGASPSSSLLVKSAKCTEKLTADYVFV